MVTTSTCSAAIPPHGSRSAISPAAIPSPARPPRPGRCSAPVAAGGSRRRSRSGRRASCWNSPAIRRLRRISLPCWRSRPRHRRVPSPRWKDCAQPASPRPGRCWCGPRPKRRTPCGSMRRKPSRPRPAASRCCASPRADPRNCRRVRRWHGMAWNCRRACSGRSGAGVAPRPKPPDSFSNRCTGEPTWRRCACPIGCRGTSPCWCGCRPTRRQASAACA